MINKSTSLEEHIGNGLRVLRPVQMLARTRNIVGLNNVVSCCAMLADVCKRSQQFATCWVFRWENKGLWDVFHLRRHFLFLVRMYLCGCVAFSARATAQHCWMCCANEHNIVGLRFDDCKTIEMLALLGSEVWPVSNFTQQLPTSRNNTQHGVQTLATS